MMDKNWKSIRLRGEMGVLIVFAVFSSFGFCWSLNDEGLALLKFKGRVVNDPFGVLSNWKDEEVDPCSWFGVGCSDGKVVALNLKDLCLSGTLAPELMKLVHLKFIILRNNSFSGVVPEGIGALKELEVLDLVHNNLSGPLPSDLDSSNLSRTILLLDNSELLGSIFPQIYGHQVLSEPQVDKKELSVATKQSSCKERFITQNSVQSEVKFHRKLLAPFYNPYTILVQRASPLAAVTPAASSVPPPETPGKTSTVPVPNKKSRIPDVVVRPPAVPPSNSSDPKNPRPSKNHIAIVAGSVGGVVILLILVVGVLLFRSNAGKSVNPWRTGLSGQLQKVFITGVPKLKRPELEAACEDFSNVIGSCPIGTLYKGTLSSGVEIAVASIAVTSAKDWSDTLEMQLRKKIESLSKINHKNFANLLGYCEEEEPFTRMMVFEYAPNGTLFEHLHIKESEHLDWGMRLRIAMGMAYCLDHMHQLNPPICHNNLISSSIYLTEDYAVKVADFSFWNETLASETESSNKKLMDTHTCVATLENNVYSFGVLLFEMMTGRLPYAVDNDGSTENWASDYLGGGTLREMADPTMESFDEEKIESISEVLKSCIHVDPKQRPSMREVTARLREITGISPDGAVPKLSPLWWAELEVLSTA